MSMEQMSTDTSSETCASARASPSSKPEIATLLVVEDNADVRLVAEDLLNLLGYQVVCAEHGTDALAVLESETRIDLLFTDMVLPGVLNGRGLIEAACHVRPGIRVLATSGYAEETLEPDGALPIGIMLLTKPYTMKALADAVEQALSSETALVV